MNGCILSNGMTTIHECAWVYNRAKLGYMIETLFYGLLIMVGIILVIMFFAWIMNVTKRLKELEKRKPVRKPRLPSIRGKKK